jgi:hypothetical protein
MVRFQSIEESLGKIKAVAGWLDKGLVYAVIISFCTGLSGYMAGSIHFKRTHAYPVVLEACSMVFQATSTPQLTPKQEGKTTAAKGTYIGSRTSRKYHHVSCPSAKLIKEGNRVYFETKEAAVAAGFVKAGNCDF